MELRAQFARLSGGACEKANRKVCSLGSMEHKAQSESDDLWITMGDDGGLMGSNGNVWWFNWISWDLMGFTSGSDQHGYGRWR